MSWLKDNLGMDWFDLAVHGTLTGLVMGALSENGAADVAIILTAGASVLLLAVRRRLALRHRGPSVAGITSGEMAAMRFEEMEHRLAELETNQARIAELEERLEFAERLLAEPTADRALPQESLGEGCPLTMEPKGINSYLGIDLLDLALHAGVTVCAMVLMDMRHAPLEMIPVTLGTSMVVLGLRRRFALKKRVETGVTSGEMAAVRLEELEQRLADFEAREARVAELEERLDFAERMLAKPEESRKWIGEAGPQ